MAAKRLDIHPAALEEMKSATISYFWSAMKPLPSICVRVGQRDRFDRKVTTALARRERDTRKFVLQRFPYAFVYREKESSIQILAVVHGHQRPGYWKDRL